MYKLWIAAAFLAGVDLAGVDLAGINAVAPEAASAQERAAETAEPFELAQRHDGPDWRRDARPRRDQRSRYRYEERWRRGEPHYDRRRHGDRRRRRDRDHRHFFRGFWYAFPWWALSELERRDRCDYWHDRCVRNWGYRNPDYRGCMRYYGCL